jgi:hypothetical protein
MQAVVLKLKAARHDILGFQGGDCDFFSEWKAFSLP